MPLHQPTNSPVLSQFNLTGKTALVTGGSRGIGLEVVTGLLEAGAAVAFTYSTTSDIEKIVTKIKSGVQGANVKAYQCDVRDAEAVNKTVNEVAKAFGKLDIVVANA